MLGSIFRNMLTMLIELGIYTEDAEHLFASRMKDTNHRITTTEPYTKLPQTM